MVSVVRSEDTNTRENQLMYCHSCSHEFSNGQSGLLECPRCNQSFIEEIDSISERSISPHFLDDFLINNHPTTDSNSILRVSVVVNSRNINSETSVNRLNRIGHGSGPIFFAQLPIEEMLNFMPSDKHPAMTREQLQEIPKASITEEQTQIQCAICFDNFTLNENEVRQLQCNHLYHEKCIFPWVQNSGTCPVCRAPLPNANLANNHASSSSIRNYLENLFGHQQSLRVETVSHIPQINNQRPSTSASATENTVHSRISPRVHSVQSQASVDGIDVELRRYRNTGNVTTTNETTIGPSTFNRSSLSMTPALSPQRVPTLTHRRYCVMRSSQRVSPSANINTHHSSTPRFQRLQRNIRPISPIRDQLSQQNSRLPGSARTTLLYRSVRKRNLHSHVTVDISSSSDDDDVTIAFNGPARKQIKIEESDSSSE